MLKKLNYFDQLASLVAAIDDSKRSSEKVISLIDSGMKIIRDMRHEKIDMGDLQDILASICICHDQPQHLADLIEMAHQEIENLLGSDASKIYLCEERL